MIKKIIYLIIIIISIISIPLLLNEKEIITKTIYKININQKQIPIGKLYISKININNDIYSKKSDRNNIEENITILKESISPEKKDSIMILAAHSGTGSIAYFERLDELIINDEVILQYNNKEYRYEVTDIYEEKKNGYIHIKESNKKQLVLTTCSPNKKDKQLIVICTEKES